MIKLHEVVKQRNKLSIGPLDLTFTSGSLTLIAGENSGGKSSLLKLLSGIIDADSGQILINNNPLKDYKADHSIAYMPDEFPLMLRTTPVALQFTFETMYPNWNTNRYYDLVKMYGINLHDNLIKLSKGYLKLFMLAVMESSGTEVLIFDEPTNGLDAKHLNEFHQFLERMQEKGCTVLIASNDINIYENVASDCLLLKKGHVELHKPVDELLLEYRLWKGSKESFNSLDPSIIVTSHQVKDTVECLVTTNIGDMTDLETILIHLRRGITV